MPIKENVSREQETFRTMWYSMFPCFFCAHTKSFEVEMYSYQNIGEVSRTICMKEYYFTDHLSDSAETILLHV